MNTVRILDLADFLNELNSREMENGSWAFRGLPEKNYDLIPSIGRKSIREQYDHTLERFVFERFRQEAAPHSNIRPSDDIEWMALARHSGLPTRLLDWSLSPLVATYFACSGMAAESDGFAVYAYDSDYYEKRGVILDAFETSSDYVEVHANHVSTRMAAQRGFFTLHRDPTKPFDHQSLIKFVFDEGCRADTRGKLDLYGINEAALFPGLDGLARYWAWFYGISVGTI